MTTFGIILFYVLGVALFIGAFYLLLWDIDSWVVRIILSPFMALIAFFVDVLIFVLLMAVSFYDMNPMPETKKEVPIYSIGGNTSFSVNGDFILGCGVINGTSTPSYRYYELVDGKYRLNEIPASNFDIVCTNLTEPKIVINATKKGAKPTLTWIFNEVLTKDINNDELTGTIYIPEGSIIQTYEIKL